MNDDDDKTMSGLIDEIDRLTGGKNIKLLVNPVDATAPLFVISGLMMLSGVIMWVWVI